VVNISYTIGAALATVRRRPRTVMAERLAVVVERPQSLIRNFGSGWKAFAKDRD
jgi:hypothetical protein